MTDPKRQPESEANPTPSVPDSVKEVAEHILVCCAGDQDATSEQKINAIVLELERFGRAQYERGVAKHHHCKDSAQICVQTARREAFKEGIEKAAEVVVEHLNYAAGLAQSRGVANALRGQIPLVRALLSEARDDRNIPKEGK